MSPLPIFLGLAAIVALLAFLTIWSRRDTWARPAAVLILLGSIPILAFAYVQSMGFHRPVSLDWFMGKRDLHVLAVKLMQDKAIWLYVDDPERDEPKPLSLPWDDQIADKIAKLQDGSRQENGDGSFVYRFDPSLDVHADQMQPLPQPKAMPPKEAPPPAQFYGQGA